MKISYKKKGEEMKGLNRREALKLMGLGGASLLTGSTSASAGTKLSEPSSKKRARIVIAGGGTGGMIAAARLRRSAPNAQITLIAPNEIHLYQSGQVHVAAGLCSEYDNKRRTADLLPDGVTWLKEKVTAFDPDTSKVEAKKSGKIPYDYLVVALG
ncbi:MAG TPA: pyridine nucleotide-disulfide oxidoreductase, partial [Epsilonproteobacteria bacterium]|nr:pyridine nucleotide-disulfide oxidoreductase [Campylobacterota bacterium]